jgi:phospholipid/cholesterol/gamma-HCH transport system substrate-binding protein
MLNIHSSVRGLPVGWGLVTLVIDRRYDRSPQDSDAAIQTSGLLGGNYIASTPGGSEHFVQQGMQLELTKSAFSIETLVNKLLAGFVAKPGAAGAS